MGSSPAIIFILGPSGVGKSEVAKWFAKEGVLHVDTDCRNGLHYHGLRRKWDQFSRLSDAAPLASALRDSAVTAGLAGVVLSVPSTRVLSWQQVEVARRAGIETVVLWGPEDACKEARRARDCQDGIPWNEGRYDESNNDAFDIYSRPEFDDIRIEMFGSDGSRRPREETMVTITRRIAG